MRALLSVSDKTGLVDLATALVGFGFEIVASGGTAAALEQAGVAHVGVAEVTGSPELLGGRVKTLHPAVHAGILADRSNPEHLAELSAHGIEPIDLVVCNLYPFEASPSIEAIDIGGVTLLRAAAKNHASVTVVVDPSEYRVVLDEIASSGAVSEPTRRRLALRAFSHTAAYDAAIASWLGAEAAADGLPQTIHLDLDRRQELRYGENPHQRGARYGEVGANDWWDGVVKHQGRELSMLNLVDAEAAFQLCHEVRGIGEGESVAIMKHANPCGVAVAADALVAYGRAFEADSMSAFGGIVAVSSPVGAELATAIVANPLADVLIAPAFDDEALALFAEKRRNMRVLSAPTPSRVALQFRQFAGGFLVGDADRVDEEASDWTVVTARRPSEEQWRDTILAWKVCARTTSNAIVLAKAGQIVGVGCGQQNRRDSARLASEKAAGRASGGAGASDAFFPFRDGLDAVCDSGVAVVVQPGGSVRDEEVIKAADERDVAMVFTGRRHFRH